MITSYEVGSIFKIVDQASPVLKLLAKQFGELDALVLSTQKNLTRFSAQRFTGLGNRIKAVNEQMAALGVSSEKAALGMMGGVDKMAESFTVAMGSARALKLEMAEIAVLSRDLRGFRLPRGGGGGPIRPGSALGEGSGGGGRGAGPHFGNFSAPLPGGSHLHMGGNAALAGAGLIGYGVYEEAQMQDAVFQLLYHTGMKGTPENKNRFRDIIQKTMSETGFGLSDVAEAAKTEARMFKGVPGGGLDIMPEILKAAAIESRLKGSSLQESMNSLIGLAHMTKEYSPEEIKKLAPAFAFLSASNPSSLGSMEKAASYAVPILQSGMEIDPLQSLLLGTVMTRAGATNTKSGTWLRNMLVGSMPGSTIVGDPKKHHDALAALGLVDGDNKPTWFTNGKPDALKMLDIAGDHAANIPLQERAALEKQAFGVQGAGAFALLADPAVKTQIKALRKEMASDEFNNRYAVFMKEYSEESPVQKFRETWADMKNVLMDIGNIVLPPLVIGMKGLDEVLKVIKVTIDFNWEILKVGFGYIVSGIHSLGAAFDWFKDKLGGLFSHTSYDGGGVGGGYGGGIIKASWGGGANDNFGGRAAAGGGSPYGDGLVGGSGGATKAMVDAAAARHGIDPRLMYGIIAGESAHGNHWDSNTKGESSWSMFQMNRVRGALGNVFERATGLDVRDPRNAPAIADFVAKYIAQGHSLAPWRGFHGKRNWDSHWGSMGYAPSAPSAPHVAPYVKPHDSQPQQLNVMLDGEVIHRSVVKHERRATEHSHQVPSFDGYHDFSAPDGQIWAA